MSAEGLKRLLETEAVRFSQPGVFNDPFEIPAVFADELERSLLNALSVAKLAGEATTDIMQETALNPFAPPEAAFRFPIQVIQRMPMTMEEAERGVIVTARPRPSLATMSTSDRDAGESGLTDEQRRELDVQRRKVARLREIDRQVGILSLTRSRENLLMWAHYAEQHHGVVVEIDTACQEFLVPAASGQEAREVRYSACRPRLMLEDELRFEPFFTKSPQWAYEEEYRIVRRLRDATLVNATAGDDFPVYLFPCPNSCIRSVALGQRFDHNAPDLVAAIRQRLASLTHVQLQKASLDPQEYRLGFSEIPPQNVEVRKN
jgi:hypothetical protein